MEGLDCVTYKKHFFFDTTEAPTKAWEIISSIPATLKIGKEAIVAGREHAWLTLI